MGRCGKDARGDTCGVSALRGGCGAQVGAEGRRNAAVDRSLGPCDAQAAERGRLFGVLLNGRYARPGSVLGGGDEGPHHRHLGQGASGGQGVCRLEVLGIALGNHNTCCNLDAYPKSAVLECPVLARGGAWRDPVKETCAECSEADHCRKRAFRWRSPSETGVPKQSPIGELAWQERRLLPHHSQGIVKQAVGGYVVGQWAGGSRLWATPLAPGSGMKPTLIAEAGECRKRGLMAAAVAARCVVHLSGADGFTADPALSSFVSTLRTGPLPTADIDQVRHSLRQPASDCRHW